MEKRIRQIRKEHDMSQVEFAKKNRPLAFGRVDMGEWKR